MNNTAKLTGVSGRSLLFDDGSECYVRPAVACGYNGTSPFFISVDGKQVKVVDIPEGWPGPDGDESYDYLFPANPYAKRGFILTIGMPYARARNGFVWLAVNKYLRYLNHNGFTVIEARQVCDGGGMRKMQRAFDACNGECMGGQYHALLLRSGIGEPLASKLVAHGPKLAELYRLIIEPLRVCASNT